MSVQAEPQIPTMRLVRAVMVDIRTLIRQELALARAEMREELARLLVVLSMFAVGVGTLAVAGLWLLIALTRGLAAIFGWPLAGVYAGIGAALGAAGIVLLTIVWYQVRRMRMLPRTRQTLSEHAHWAARHVSQAT